MFEIIKPFHITCATLTILFFIVRGAIHLRDPLFVDRTWVRRIAATVDTLLLASGVTLAWLTAQTPWQDYWLAAKLGLILLYILLGMMAFHWGKTPTVRLSAWLLALLTVVIIVWIAVTHSPIPFQEV